MPAAVGELFAARFESARPTTLLPMETVAAVALSAVVGAAGFYVGSGIYDRVAGRARSAEVWLHRLEQCRSDNRHVQDMLFFANAVAPPRPYHDSSPVRYQQSLLAWDQRVNGTGFVQEHMNHPADRGAPASLAPAVAPAVAAAAPGMLAEVESFGGGPPQDGPIDGRASGPA